MAAHSSLDTFSEGGLHYRTIDLDGPDAHWDEHLPWAHAVLFVIDVTDQQAIADSAEILPKLVPYIPMGTVFMVWGNKADLAEDCSLADLITALQLPTLGEQIQGINIFAVSAKTGQNLDIATDWLATRMLELHAQQVKIYDIYVYQADTGIGLGRMLGSRHSVEQSNQRGVTTLYNALNTFAMEGVGYQGIKSIQIDFDEGVIRQVVKVQRQSAGVLVVCGPKDPEVVIQEIGLALLQEIETNYAGITDVLPDENLLSTQEILSLSQLRPWLAQETLTLLQSGGFLADQLETGGRAPATPLLQTLQDRLSFLPRLTGTMRGTAKVPAES
jgi:hypothetical protein